MTAIGERPRAARRGSRLDVKALAVFFALSYALSWSWAVPLAAAHLVVRRGVGWPTHLPALLGPAIAAVVVTAWTMGRPGVRDLLARLTRWRVPLRWWLVAVSPVAFLGLALAAMAAAGQALPGVGDYGRFSGIPAMGLVGVLLLIFAGALGEETGWRGYALPQLQRRFSPLASSLILAVLWFGWHLPQFFVIATYRDFGPVGYLGMFLGLACGAVVLTWLYNRSGGSILLVAVWHGLYNVVAATQAATGMLAAVVSTLIMIQGIGLIVADLRARRRGQPSVLGPA
ncbi:MAG: CPBP family intramembrane glutamic endopeptidase [Streptosporangiales bacterium]